MHNLTSQQYLYLKELGIPLYERQSWLMPLQNDSSKRDYEVVATSAVADPKLSHNDLTHGDNAENTVTSGVVKPSSSNTIVHAEAASQASSTDAQAWKTLAEQVSTCTKCPLHEGRTHSVFGVGNQSADLLVVGEAPGYYEDQQGEPFVGRAGQLLNKMLKAINLDRNEVYIANVLKCRPPNNRDPLPTEVARCTPYLQQQIDLLKPRLILALGRVSAHYLLDNTLSLARMRGRTFNYGTANTPLLVTYHPAYLLRSPQDKRKAYDDLLKVKALLESPPLTSSLSAP